MTTYLKRTLSSLLCLLLVLSLTMTNHASQSVSSLLDKPDPSVPSVILTLKECITTTVIQHLRTCIKQNPTPSTISMIPVEDTTVPENLTPLQTWIAANLTTFLLETLESEEEVRIQLQISYSPKKDKYLLIMHTGKDELRTIYASYEEITEAFTSKGIIITLVKKKAASHGYFVECSNLIYAESSKSKSYVNSFYFQNNAPFEEYVQTAIQTIGLNTSWTEADAVSAILEYVENYYIYDLNSRNADLLTTLSDQHAVCWHYARLVQAICNEVGIECGYVTGTVQPSNGYHAWNYIKINDEWHWADACWNDTPAAKYQPSSTIWSDHITGNIDYHSSISPQSIY